MEKRSAADNVVEVARPEDHQHVAQDATAADLPAQLPPETGGQAGLEPTRYGDWEKKGRCTDF
ncbi:DUF1674 domain-containing protein [Granulosicoccus sp. 3-233]|uniref:DUF1674 domain-containing protein n=1 Tax=Granulosicoccus sp. 3-233 TaxID=3417969 RepID=UPI003D33E3AA